VIKVIGIIPCEGTLIECDPWIPLKVSWLPTVQRQPLYVRISGQSGGEIECKVDPISGSLRQMILLLPPQSIATPSQLGMVNDEHDPFAPIVDCSIWKETPKYRNESTPGGSLVRCVSTISLKRAHNGMSVGIGESSPVSFVRAGNVEIGYTADEHLANITAVFDAENP
jgi:hypothetical protein